MIRGRGVPLTAPITGRGPLGRSHDFVHGGHVGRHQLQLPAFRHHVVVERAEDFVAEVGELLGREVEVGVRLLERLAGAGDGAAPTERARPTGARASDPTATTTTTHGPPVRQNERSPQRQPCVTDRPAGRDATKGDPLSMLPADLPAVARAGGDPRAIT
jgi:hypothetical protein